MELASPHFLFQIIEKFVFYLVVLFAKLLVDAGIINVVMCCFEFFVTFTGFEVLKLVDILGQLERFLGGIGLLILWRFLSHVNWGGIHLVPFQLSLHPRLLSIKFLEFMVYVFSGESTAGQKQSFLFCLLLLHHTFLAIGLTGIFLCLLGGIINRFLRLSVY